MLEKLEDRIVELSEKLEGLTVEHGEQAVDLAASVAQAEAIHSLLWPPFLFIPTLALSVISWMCWRKKKAEPSSDWQIGGGAFLGFACLMGSIWLVTMVNNWTSVVLWRAAFDPYFALAAEVLGKL